MFSFGRDFIPRGVAVAVALAVTLGAVQVGAIFDDQELLIYFKGSAEHTHKHKKKEILKKHIQRTHTQTHHT